MSSTLSPSPPTAGRGAPAALAVLLTALFVITLDFFVVNVALPSMRDDLGAGAGTVTIWVAGYAIAFGAFLVLGARLGDRLGRRRMFLWGLALFTVASAACGAVPDPTSLALARVVQGLGAALLSPQVLSTITATTEGEQRVRALTAYGLTAGLAAVGGQLIGGALIALDVAGLGWRTCFLINVPIGIVALALAPRLIPETRAGRRMAIDGPSVVMLSLGLGLLVLPLAEGQGRGWPLWCFISLGLAAELLVAFALRQRRLVRGGRDSLVDLAMLRERTLGVGTVLVLVLQAGIASSFFVLALALQGGLGLSALDSGLVFTTLAVGYVASSVAAPALLARLGRGLLIEGAVLSVVGQVLLALTASEVHAGGSVAPLIPGLVIAGIGMGMLFAPSVSLTLATTTAERSGEASGVVTTVQQIGGALGVALLGIVFYGALGTADYAHAFAVASWCLVGQSIVVGLLALRLAPHARPGIGSWRWTEATAARVGPLLRQWRTRRHMSQMDLALEAGVSTRHLSFVETGRSRPSAEMVMQLAEHLAVPLRDRNMLLLAAGFAPVYGQRGLDEPEMGPVREALDRVLAGHEPFPALVVDRHWGLVAANTAIGLLTAGSAAHLLEPPVNVLRLSLHPEGVAPRILNLDVWRVHILDALGRTAVSSGDPALAALHDELAALRPEGRGGHGPAVDLVAGDIAVPLRLLAPDGTTELSFISTRTMFGTAVDVTVAELSIESFFPADAVTSDYVRAWTPSP